MPCNFTIGERVKILDDIMGTVQEGIIFFIEPDNEILGLNWLYLMSEIEEDNTIFEPRFQKPYWKIVPDNAEFIVEDED